MTRLQILQLIEGRKIALSCPECKQEWVAYMAVEDPRVTKSINEMMAEFANESDLALGKHD